MDIDGLFKIPYIVVGAIGGAVSVVFGKNKPKTIRQYARSSIFILIGAVITNFLTPLIIKLIPSLEGVEHGTGLVVGLFGIGAIEAIYKVIHDLQSDPYGTIKKFKDMFKE